MTTPEKPIPRWQQGFASFAFSDVQARMTPRQRRSAFIGDGMLGCGVSIVGALIALALGKISVHDLMDLIGLMLIFLVILFIGNRDPFPEPPEPK